MAPLTYYEFNENKTGKQFIVEAENDEDDKPLLKYLGALGTTVESTTAATYRNDTTFVFRKMAEAEYKTALANQNMPLHLTNQKGGEKWLTESLEHSKVFKNKGVTQPEGVVEFGVDKNGYKTIRDQAIPQQGSGKFQPKRGETDFKNISNKERLGTESPKINLGLKGEKNVTQFNKFVTKVTKINPESFVNKSQVLRWIRRNPVRCAGLALGVAIDATIITLSVIEDNGTFGKSTQISLGQMVGGMVGAAAATYIGAQIGAALGTIVPVIGNIILGFVGGLIGSLVGGGLVEFGRYLFGIAPVAPGPGAPILDTDPQPTLYGTPNTGLQTGISGAPSLGLNTGAFGAPSLGLDTGVSGHPETDYKTRRKTGRTERSNLWHALVILLSFLFIIILIIPTDCFNKYPRC